MGTGAGAARTGKSAAMALLAARPVIASAVKNRFMLSRIGIADDIKSKTTIPNTDVVSELVAKGEVELGIVVITQILTTPGVELVRPLPPEIKVTTTFAGGISASSQSPSAASDLLKFLHSDVALKVIRKQDMEPVL